MCTIRLVASYLGRRRLYLSKLRLGQILEIYSFNLGSKCRMEFFYREPLRRRFLDDAWHFFRNVLFECTYVCE